MVFLTEDDIRVSMRDSFFDAMSDEDEDVISISEASAIAKMKSMLRQRYDVSKVFGSANYSDKPLIVEYCTTIFLHRLAARINPRKIPSNLTQAYLEALSWLEKCAKGEANPDLPLLDQETTNTSDKVYYYNPATKRDNSF